MEGRVWQLALIVGAVVLTLLMLAHPEGVHAAHGSTEGQSGYTSGDDAMQLLSYVVHGGAVAATILIAFGMLGLGWRLGLQRPLILLAVVVFFFAAVAVMLAAMLNGFVAPKLVGALMANKITMDEARLIGSYNWWFNQALANFHTVAGSTTILLLSLGWPSWKPLHVGLRILGLAIGIALPALFLFGPFKMDVHGAALAAVAINTWFVLAALLGGTIERARVKS